ncbi:MAG: metabolite traffic protein EboE [Geminicoccaceae bacterium]|nr:metabolite traffic protein EboE [Geminicoccaceae bacterium]
MRLATRAGDVHLTYCTNIHRGETWEETFAALARSLPAIKARASPDIATGVGLRLSAAAAEGLARPGELDRFRAWLREHDLYVFTLNGFPYGAFHGVRVKERVYEPDWRSAERLRYTSRLAELLAALLPEEHGLEGSLSTVPLGFRPLRREPGALRATAANLLEAVAGLVELERRTGKRIALALEPEPMCALETTAEAVAFLEEYVLAREPLSELARKTGLSPGGAEAAARRHLGVCFDVCHAAVEFEEPEESADLLARAGIAVPKIQLSAALRVPAVAPETASVLRRFDDGIYLHQVVERTVDGRLRRYLDLPDALAAIGSALGAEWRVHCHVPIFTTDLAPGLLSTRPSLERLLALQRERPLARHLEVETYTFEALPEEFRRESLEEAVVRELAWARAQLLS